MYPRPLPFCLHRRNPSRRAGEHVSSQNSQRNQFYTADRTPYRRHYRRSALPHRCRAGKAPQSVRYQRHIFVAIRCAYIALISGTAEKRNPAGNRNRRLVGNHTAACGSRRAQVARTVSVGLACRCRLCHRIYPRRTRKTCRCVYGEIQGNIRKISLSHRLMVYRRPYTGIYVRQIPYRGFLQL